jgi:hypothetical protein
MRLRPPGCLYWSKSRIHFLKKDVKPLPHVAELPASVASGMASSQSPVFLGGGGGGAFATARSDHEEPRTHTWCNRHTPAPACRSARPTSPCPVPQPSASNPRSPDPLACDLQLASVSVAVSAARCNSEAHTVIVKTKQHMQ